MKARLLGGALALLLPLALIAGCSQEGGTRDTLSGPETTETSGEATGSDATDVGETATNDIVIYLMRDDEKVHPMRRSVQGDGVAAGALEALFAGPTGDETADGNTSSIPAGTRLLGVTVDAGVATVDVSPEFSSGGGSLSMMSRVAQVVFTATQFDTVKSVRFEIDGEPVDALGGEGIILEDAQTRADWEDFAPVILVETPARGDTLQMGDTVSVKGSANVFEARFTLEVTDGDGLILLTQAVQASSGTGTRGTFDVRVTPAGGKPGLGAIIVSYASPKDGARVVIDEIPVTFE